MRRGVLGVLRFSVSFILMSLYNLIASDFKILSSVLLSEMKWLKVCPVFCADLRRMPDLSNFTLKPLSSGSSSSFFYLSLFQNLQICLLSTCFPCRPWRFWFLLSILKRSKLCLAFFDFFVVSFAFFPFPCNFIRRKQH